MKKLLTGAALFAAATAAHAEYLDVIAFQMTGECTFAEYMETVNEFNEWAEPRGYTAQVLMPLSSDNLQTYYWVGTSADAAVFGKAYEEWLDGMGDSKSAPSRLNARFGECVNNMSRSSYHAY
jgi:hypothetical protein